MQSNQSGPAERPSLEAAVAFFQHPARQRLLDALYHKYLQLGRIGGQVILENCTLEERQEIASLLDKAVSQQETVTIRLSAIQHMLIESRFACTLPELLQAAFPRRPLITNVQQREQRTRAHEQFRLALLTLVAEQEDGSPAHRWLSGEQAGWPGYFRRYKNATSHEQSQVIASLSLVARALHHLPIPPTYERLALFAERVSGDPHALDPTTFTGRIFSYALNTLFNRQLETEKNESIPTELGTDESTAPHEQQRHLLYYDAGLLLDTISSNVVVASLKDGGQQQTVHDPLLSAAGGRVLLLPLRQLLDWRYLHANGDSVYIVENPQVFETLIDQLGMDTGTQVQPTLVCTSGWPSVAAIRLLNLLCETSPHLKLYYSGDFDIQGLRIAAHLYGRYGARLHLWHYTAQAYQAALHRDSQTLNTSELAALQTLPEPFTALCRAMGESQKKAYQEGITTLLLHDLQTRA